MVITIKNTFVELVDPDDDVNDYRPRSWSPSERRHEMVVVSIGMSSEASCAGTAASTDDGETSKSGSGSIQQTPPQTPRVKQAHTSNSWDGQQDDDSAKASSQKARTCAICGRVVPTDSETLKIGKKGKKIMQKTTLDAEGTKYYCECLLKQKWTNHSNTPEHKCKPCIDWHSKGQCRKELDCMHCHFEHDNMPKKAPRLQKKERETVNELTTENEALERKVRELEASGQKDKAESEKLKAKVQELEASAQKDKAEIEKLKAKVQELEAEKDTLKVGPSVTQDVEARLLAIAFAD